MDNKSGVDTITDFTLTEDTIDLRDVLHIQPGAYFAIDDYVSARSIGNNQTMLSVDTDGKGPEAKVDIAILSNTASLDIHSLFNQHHLLVV